MGKFKLWFYGYKIDKIISGVLVVGIITTGAYLFIDTTDNPDSIPYKIKYYIKEITDPLSQSVKEFFIPNDLLSDEQFPGISFDDLNVEDPKNDKSESTRVPGKFYGEDMEEVAKMIEDNAEFECYIDWSKGTITPDEQKEILSLLEKLISNKVGGTVKVTVPDTTLEYFVTDENILILPVHVEITKDGKVVESGQRTYKIGYKYNYLELLD